MQVLSLGKRLAFALFMQWRKVTKNIKCCVVSATKLRIDKHTPEKKNNSLKLYLILGNVYVLHVQLACTYSHK